MTDPVTTGSVERGRAARKEVPRSSHADWNPASDRPDPVSLLDEQNATRVDWLVPIRHFRMSASPFTFYRGSARIMATDLATTPSTGLDVQVGGDAHLSNFGAYASPERQLVFDANDFDETLRGPWEWDLKRLAVSFTIAAQDQSMPVAVTREVTATVVRTYREAMARHATQGVLDIWYEHVRVDDVRAAIEAGGLASEDITTRLERFERKARSKTNLQALKKLTLDEGGRRRFRADPPVLLPLHSLPDQYDPDGLEAQFRAALDAYKETLADDRRWLLDQYQPVDFAVKVVGVGSVGTRCLIALFEGLRAGDPLFLQAKEASASVLEEHLGASPYANHGQRVVEGQRMIQAESDIFLGWTQGGAGHQHYYIRQLRDWKGSADIASFDAESLAFYAEVCGRTLARGHARSGDPCAIASYLGKSDTMDKAITRFAERYAQQNEQDYAAFTAAIDSGRLPIEDERDAADLAKAALAGLS